MTTCRHVYTMTGDARMFEAAVAERPEMVNHLAHGGYQALEVCHVCSHWRRVAWNGEHHEYGDWHRPATYGSSAKRSLVRGPRRRRG